MIKRTRLAYSGLSLRENLAELVNLANLDDLPSHNPDLHSRRSPEHPNLVRVTIIVERVAQPRPKRPSVPNRAAGGHATAAAMTKDQRIDRARKGAQARKDQARLKPNTFGYDVSKPGPVLR